MPEKKVIKRGTKAFVSKERTTQRNKKAATTLRRKTLAKNQRNKQQAEKSSVVKKHTKGKIVQGRKTKGNVTSAKFGKNRSGLRVIPRGGQVISGGFGGRPKLK